MFLWMCMVCSSGFAWALPSLCRSNKQRAQPSTLVFWRSTCYKQCNFLLNKLFTLKAACCRSYLHMSRTSFTSVCVSYFFSFSLWLCPRVKGTELDIISIYLLKKISAISNGYGADSRSAHSVYDSYVVRMIGQLVRTLFSLNGSFCSYYILKDCIRTSPIWMSDKGRKSNECVTTWSRLVFHVPLREHGRQHCCPMAFTST